MPQMKTNWFLIDVKFVEMICDRLIDEPKCLFICYMKVFFRIS